MTGAQHGPIHDRTMVHVNFYIMKTHLARPKVRAETEDEESYKWSTSSADAHSLPNWPRIYIYDHLNYVLYIESYVRVMQALMEPCVAITSQRARCTEQKA